MRNHEKRNRLKVSKKCLKPKTFKQANKLTSAQKTEIRVDIYIHTYVYTYILQRYINLYRSSCVVQKRVHIKLITIKNLLLNSISLQWIAITYLSRFLRLFRRFLRVFDNTRALGNVIRCACCWCCVIARFTFVCCISANGIRHTFRRFVDIDTLYLIIIGKLCML